jgi:hypothetical protein
MPSLNPRKAANISEAIERDPCVADWQWREATLGTHLDDDSTRSCVNKEDTF